MDSALHSDYLASQDAWVVSLSKGFQVEAAPGAGADAGPEQLL